MGAYMAVKSVKGPGALDADALCVRLNLEYEQRPCATIGGFW
jgi:hypothetical protein